MTTIPESIMREANECVAQFRRNNDNQWHLFVASALQAAEERGRKEERERFAGGLGLLVRKKSGSWWEGRVVGFYSTEQTPIGYAVQLDKPNGPVQIYPEGALEAITKDHGNGN